MRKVRKNIATRQVIHIVGEGLTELFYFSHLKKLLGYSYSISPRLFENTCRHFQDSAATERALKRYLPTYNKTRKYLEKDSWVKDMITDAKMIKACELAEKYQDRDSYSEIYKAIRKINECFFESKKVHK